MYKFFIILFLIFIVPNVYGYNFNITAGSAIVMDFESNNILYSKNIETKVYPASTTKILTAILAIENLDLNKSITISKESLNLVPEGSSLMKLKANQTLTVKDLLYGLLLPSRK